MKRQYKLAVLFFAAVISPSLSGCSKDNDQEPSIDEDKYPIETNTIGFENAPANLFGNSPYGSNLYDGSISTGFITNIYGDTYAQFPINYGYNYDAEFNLTWCYTYYNGGLALSHYHDLTGDTYMNQLSVYNSSSPSGGNFIVANGSSRISEPEKANLADYEGCAKIYLTDEKGYGVNIQGEKSQVSGVGKKGWFRSVWINNTTYTFLTMKNGNPYCAVLNEENEGWYKVQFIAFENTNLNAKPIGYTEMFLANFKKGQADDYIGIIEEWIKVDLSMLPESSLLVINFVGSDSGEWGLNTPAYCALDNFEISVLKE